MINPEIERIKAKLELWNTPGFSQFIEDMQNVDGQVVDIVMLSKCLRHCYIAKLDRLKDEEEAKQKFKQGKLEL